MYKAYYDGKIFYDPRIEELALIDPVVELVENKAGSFTFTMPPEHPEYKSIQRRESIVEVYNDTELIFCGMAMEVTEDFWRRQKIYCEGELSYLNDSIQRQAKYQNMTVRGLLETYINNHNAQVEDSKKFTIGVVTVTDTNDSLYRYTNMQSTMQELKEDLIDDLGGYLRVRHTDGIRYIDYLADSQHTSTQVIKLGKNLVDYSSNIDSADIATAIIPLGAKLDTPAVEGLETRLDIKSVNDGFDYIFNQEAVNTYGWIYQVVTWDDVTVPANLKTKGQQYLSDIQYENIVIEAKAVDLHWTNQEVEQFRLSDKIQVISSPHGLNRFFRLTKQTLHLDAPEKDTITLGKSEKLTLSAKSNKESQVIKKAMESIVPASDILTQAKENATELITTAMGGYVYKTNSELYIMDTNNPDTATKVWRWNINGLGYSSAGINGPYDLAMTMDGNIVADFITTGLLKAIEIKNGNGFSVTKDGRITATSGTVGGWNINSRAIYKDVKIGTTIYRVYFQPPYESNPDDTWVLSCQKSIDGGTTFTGTFVLHADGSAAFGDGTTIIESTGEVSFCNGTLKITPSGSLFAKDFNGTGCGISTTIKGVQTSVGVNYDLKFIGGILVNMTIESSD